MSPRHSQESYLLQHSVGALRKLYGSALKKGNLDRARVILRVLKRVGGNPGRKKYNVRKNYRKHSNRLKRSYRRKSRKGKR